MATLRMGHGPGLERLEQAGHTVGGWVARYARFGYAARGVVYATIGVLAVKLALGYGGKTTDTQGALVTLAQQPFSIVLLSLLAAGLVAFAAWRFVQAILDPEQKGRDGKGILTRVSYFISGGMHVALALSAAHLVTGAGVQRGRGTQGWTAELLSKPFGAALVALVGAGVLAFALVQFRNAYTAKFREKLSLERLTPAHRQWALRVSRFGLAARGAVFTLISGFLLLAALTANPREAKGLDESLAVLAEQPFGAVLLGIVALGLVAYAAYLFLQARYRRIAAP
ncbi:DUF1206 domain-containing protein [Stigmatella aurantiaca]|uniref:Conserved uncharacterized protein n=1 Tax=Stigmatella aurantiaca (strain DW4/3-1) TaxID=378806 RepID=Q09C08_STIAD|nr:DUF1206 domain-containing protein [Stigmatella aurantiaca]ADO74400.1 conserved uncharacterized protein [Stigmatella aurantiaca DW4/3-1]EAU69326.1 conserved hypothetical protein [Stigmatella aurantiaca DW4/3-1]